MISRFLKWLVFTFCVSLLPLLAVTSSIYFWTGFFPTWEEILGSGELLGICGALAATAIGDILAAKRRPRAKMICVPISGIVVLVAVLWYCVVGLQIKTGTKVDKELVVFGSIVLYILTAITSAFCVALSDEK